MEDRGRITVLHLSPLASCPFRPSLSLSVSQGTFRPGFCLLELHWDLRRRRRADKPTDRHVVCMVGGQTSCCCRPASPSDVQFAEISSLYGVAFPPSLPPSLSPLPSPHGSQSRASSSSQSVRPQRLPRCASVLESKSEIGKQAPYRRYS